MLGRKTKKCPRCGNICLISQVVCDDCGLMFSRLDDATNKAGKIRLKRKDKERVIYVRRCPKDVKKWKLFLMSLFLGLVGGHYFYVGRWKLGLCMLVYFLAVALIGVVFNPYFLTIMNGTFFSYFGPLTGIYVFVWIFDNIRILTNKFRIPVSIITKEDEELYQAELSAKKSLKEKEKSVKKEIKLLQKQTLKESRKSEKEEAKQAKTGKTSNQKEAKK